jgi:cytochrome c oxidase cbb3-type subunit 3
MYSRFLKLALSLSLLVSCQQQPAETSSPAASHYPRGNTHPTLRPGFTPETVPTKNRLEENDEVIGEGKVLYSQFNCSGCHAGGGGAIGPPLMDDEWVYGSSAGNIFWTIMEGRPQGMPSFGGKVAEEQAWKIAAYVRSLSGLNKK